METEDEVAAAVGSLAEILEVRKDPQPVTEPISETAPDPAPVTAEKPRPERRHLGWRILLWTLIVVFALAALLLGAFLLAAQLWPDAVDSLLYNAEELELIRSLQI